MSKAYERAWKTLRGDPDELQRQKELLCKLEHEHTKDMTPEEKQQWLKDSQVYKGPHDW